MGCGWLLGSEEFTLNANEVRQELKFQMALRHKLGLFPVQWQCRFRTLASKGFIEVFYIHVLFISDD